MSFRVEWEQSALSSLDKLPRSIINRLLAKIIWLTTNIEKIKPEPLSGTLKGYWKLRVGDYRVIYTLKQSEKLIVIEELGHRREIYKEK